MTNIEKNIILAALSSYRRKLMDQSVSFLILIRLVEM